MAYAGATIRITATVTDYNGNQVTSSGVTSAVVSLYDSSGNYVFTNQALTWSATESYWYYDWANSVAGSFYAECIFNGPSYEVYDYGRILVSSPRVTPTGLPH